MGKEHSVENRVVAGQGPKGDHRVLSEEVSGQSPLSTEGRAVQHCGSAYCMQLARPRK